MAESTTEIDLDSVIDRLLEGEFECVPSPRAVCPTCGWRSVSLRNETGVLAGVYRRSPAVSWPAIASPFRYLCWALLETGSSGRIPHPVVCGPLRLVAVTIRRDDELME
jgi:hypothetical protein